MAFFYFSGINSMPKFLIGNGRYAKAGDGWKIKDALLDAWSVSRDKVNEKRHLSMAGALTHSRCSPAPPAKHEYVAKTYFCVKLNFLRTFYDGVLPNVLRLKRGRGRL